jgi:capsular exopolysaccharide synthesis family protein
VPPDRINRRGLLSGNENNTAEWLQPPVEEEGLRRYVETIRERLGLVLVTILITTGAAIVYVVNAPKTYEATADLLVTPVSGEDPTLTSLPLIRESVDPTRDVETASLLVTNTDVAERVRAKIASEKTAQALLGDVTAEPVAQSNFVAVTAKAGSPEEAQEVANAFATETVADRTEELHEAVTDRLASLTSLPATEQAQLETLAAAPTPDLRLETEADVPASQSSPRPLLSVAGGILAGLVLGIAGAFASQVLDPRLRRETQLRRLYDLPILARVPLESGKKGTPLSPRELSPVGAEAYRTLRSTLSVNGTGGGTILVTGPSPGEGKSTTAINLASSLALAGKRVIMIEADLRRPSLGDALGITSERGGVVSVLIENTKLEDALVASPTYGNNLRVLAADYEGGWIAELFSIPAAERMIDDARRLADYVIIDSPPLNEVVDSLPLARRADEVLIVVRLGKTRMDKISQLAELLAENRIRPIGFAVIGTPRPSRGEYHYYAGAGQNGSVGDRKLFGKTSARS